MKTLNIFLFIMLFSQLIYADMSDSMFFSLNTIYIDRDYKDNNVTTKYKATDNDLRLMKINLKRLAFGVIYAQSSADASDVSRSSYGLSIGYFSDKDFYIC